MAAKKPIDRIIDATLALVEERGWPDISLTDIAEAAKVPLAKLREHAADKAAILDALRARVDAATLAAAAQEEWTDETARDRLFDVIMMRFDQLAPYKGALRRLSRDLGRDPAAILTGARRTAASMDWMLEAAKIEVTGLSRRLMAQGLTGVYARAVQVWLGEDDAGMPKTMARLDQDLTRAVRLWGMVGPLAARAADVRFRPAGKPETDAA